MQSCVADWSMILGYMRGFLSWPVLAGCLGVYFLRKFDQELGELLRNIKRFKVPGAELETTLSEKQANPVQLGEPWMEFRQHGRDSAGALELLGRISLLARVPQAHVRVATKGL